MSDIVKEKGIIILEVPLQGPSGYRHWSIKMKTLLCYLDLQTVVDPDEYIYETPEVQAGKERRALYMIYNNIALDMRDGIWGYTNASNLWKMVYDCYAERHSTLFDFRNYKICWIYPSQLFLSYSISIQGMLQSVYGNDKVPSGWAASIRLCYRDFDGKIQLVNISDTIVELSKILSSPDCIGRATSERNVYHDRFLHISELQQYLCLYLAM